MASDIDSLAEYRRTFRRLFDGRSAQVALLDLSGVILETNIAWQQFGQDNGLARSYEPVGRNYLSLCEAGISESYPSAREAYVGLLEVMETRRPKFTMVYPCHSPLMRRWYRMWVEPQLPEVPAIIVAHYLYLTKPVLGLDGSGDNRMTGQGWAMDPLSGEQEKQRN